LKIDYVVTMSDKLNKLNIKKNTGKKQKTTETWKLKKQTEEIQQVDLHQYLELSESTIDGYNVRP